MGFDDSSGTKIVRILALRAIVVWETAAHVGHQTHQIGSQYIGFSGIVSNEALKAAPLDSAVCGYVWMKIGVVKFICSGWCSIKSSVSELSSILFGGIYISNIGMGIVGSRFSDIRMNGIRLWIWPRHHRTVSAVDGGLVIGLWSQRHQKRLGSRPLDSILFNSPLSIWHLWHLGFNSIDLYASRMILFLMLWSVLWPQ